MARVRILYRAGVFAGVLLWAAPAAVAQYPPTYPPTYPPSPYPYPYPYPDDRVRLPGGVPVEVPTIKLPKRTPKDKEKDKAKPPTQGAESLKMTLRGVDGTLRELGEKHLYVEVGAGPKKLLRFRLLAKSQFRNQQGEPIRDSLLKPGDQLTLQVNVDDPETALRVILSRAGTEAERTAAGRPFDHDSAKAPEEADTRPVGVIELADSGVPGPAAPAGASEAEMDPGRPRLERRPQSAPEAEAAPQYTVEGVQSADDEIIAAARMAAASFAAEIPNFLVQQYTTRYYSDSLPVSWHVRDVVSAEVASVNGTEEYRNIQLNGRPSSDPPERTGAWSTGEFVTTLQDIMQPGVASFVRSGQDQVAGRIAYVYKYTVTKANSHWRLVAPRENLSERPPYEGTVWIDKERKCVLRIEQRATGISSGFPYDRAETTLEYDWVRIDGKPFLLPTLSENLMCMRGTASCSKNEIAFRNYRKFTAESNITFGNLVPIRY